MPLDEGAHGFEEAADAFSRLSDPTRVAIVRALGDPQAPGRPRETSFSTLRKRVDAGSARFNYHLNALRDHFVEERDGAYRLTHPGLLVYTLLQEDVFDRETTIDPFPANAPCHEPGCDGDLQAGYDDGCVEIHCPACDTLLYRRPIPPTIVGDGTCDSLLDATATRLHREFATRRRGRCPACLGIVEPRFAAGRPDRGRSRQLDVHLVHDCDTCDIFAFTSVGEHLLAHPAVNAFAHDGGIDLPSQPPWQYAWTTGDEHTVIRSRDPWTIHVDVSVGGRTATFVLDDDRSVERL